MLQPQVSMPQMVSGAAVFVTAALVSVFFTPSDILRYTEPNGGIVPAVVVDPTGQAAYILDGGVIEDHAGIHFDDNGNGAAHEIGTDTGGGGTQEQHEETKEEVKVPEVPVGPKVTIVDNKVPVEVPVVKPKTLDIDDKDYATRVAWLYNYMWSKVGGTVFGLIVTVNLVTISVMVLHAIYRHFYPGTTTPAVQELAKLKQDQANIQRRLSDLNGPKQQQVPATAPQLRRLSPSATNNIVEKTPTVSPSASHTPEDLSATQIQAAYRGYKTREAIEKENAVGVIQKAYRQYDEKKKLNAQPGEPIVPVKKDDPDYPFAPKGTVTSNGVGHAIASDSKTNGFGH